jgi:hypothetical protein
VAVALEPLVQMLDANMVALVVQDLLRTLHC